jgi:hypothetical protein
VTDLPSRLSHYTCGVDDCRNPACNTIREAADEIVRLRNQLDAARTGKALLALEAAQAEIADLKADLAGALSRVADEAKESAEVDRCNDAMSQALAAERALCDQLAEALRGVIEPGCTYYDGHPLVDALAAYEAARKEGA